MGKKFKGIHTISVLCMCILMFNLFTGCESGKGIENTENEKKVQKIIVGSDNYPPYNYINTDGKATGIDVDLAKEAFQRIGYEAEFQFINWEEKKTLLSEGKVDCVWGSFTMNGREDEYKWAGPYMVSRQVVAVNKNSDIQTFKDLEGKIVAVQSTTKPEEIFRDHKDMRIPRLREVISVQNRELIYTFLSKGYADAVAAHETAILQYMSDYDLEYRILEEPLLTVGLGVAFDQNDDRGIDRKLTKVFEEMKEDGTTERIIGKYLNDAGKYLEVDTYEQ